MVSKLDKQTYTSEFESHWALYSPGLVQHLSKKLGKLIQPRENVKWTGRAFVFLSRQKIDVFPENINTDNEKRVFCNNVSCKKQWIDNNESSQPTSRAELRGRKVMCLGRSQRSHAFWVLKRSQPTNSRHCPNNCNMCMKISYLPDPSARVGYDTRSIFKRSLTDLNAEFSFS